MKYLLFILFTALVIQIVQAQPIEVEWYQVVEGKLIPVEFITPIGK